MILKLLFIVALLPQLGQGADPVIAESDFVDVRSIDPTIKIELRYAGPNNFTRRALYPANARPLLRFSVAQRLFVAQKYLKERGFGLKIWDAYRPQVAQARLWEAIRNTDFVADPKEGVGSMHTRGVAVDVTLVDGSGKEAVMPTDFDNFTPAAVLAYLGPDPIIRSNLNLLQRAMARAGFYGLRTEWWHFCAGDWANYPQISEVQPVVKTPTPHP